jgi:hypothetical protein
MADSRRVRGSENVRARGSLPMRNLQTPTLLLVLVKVGGTSRELIIPMYLVDMSISLEYALSLHGI